MDLLIYLAVLGMETRAFLMLSKVRFIFEWEIIFPDLTKVHSVETMLSCFLLCCFPGSDLILMLK
jgi:hypothetical protein